MDQAYGSPSGGVAIDSKLTPQKSNGILKNIGSFFTRFKVKKSIFPARLTAKFDENGKRTKKSKPEIFLFDENQPYHRKAQRMLEAIERSVNSKEPGWQEIASLADSLFKKQKLMPFTFSKKPKYRHEAHEAIRQLAHSLYSQEKTAMNDVRMKLLGILARKYAEKVPSNSFGFQHDLVNWSEHMRHYKEGVSELAGELKKKHEEQAKEEALKLAGELKEK